MIIRPLNKNQSFYLKPLLLVVCLLFFPASTRAAVLINEVAWPNTNFAIVLVVAFLLGKFVLARTEVSQNWCMGKMGLVVILFIFPGVTQAAVLINEVAWMGTDNSANDEWIELYNNSTTAVDLGGWLLTDGMNLNINFPADVGVIAPGALAVLERTDDDSSPASAFLIYTGALSNTGSTLTLKKADSSVTDQVAGGESWENIGGDNTTKETAQYTGTGWITAPATPGYTNYTEDPTIDEVETKTIKNSPFATPSRVVATNQTLTLPNNTLSLEVQAPAVAYVNQPIDFRVVASGIGSTLINSLSYDWNFGDLTMSSSKEANHTYAFPGQYIVTVYGSYARHEAIGRHVVTVLPVNFSLTRSESGDIQINNNAKYEIDLSGFTLVGKKKVLIPARTFLAPNGSITISKSHLAVSAKETVFLFDQSNELVAMSNNGAGPGSVALSAPVRSSVNNNQVYSVATPVLPVSTEVPENLETDTTPFNFGSDEEPAQMKTATSVAEDLSYINNSNLATVASADSPVTDKWPYLALFFLMVVATGGVLVKK